MANYEYIDLTGVIVPDTTELLTQVENEWKSIFGQDLIVTPDTPQGMQIAAEVKTRSIFLANNAAVANQLNPNISGGVFLDATLQLTGLERTVEKSSSVLVTLAGVPGTIISQSGVILDDGAGGTFFTNDSTITLDGSGNGSVNFTALIPGPIGALANTLTHIVSGPLGLETATNPSSATLGFLTQSDSAARAFRKGTLAFQGSSLAEAIVSGLLATPGVTGKPTFKENVTDSPLTIDGVTLAPHSLYVCVDGGTDSDVATTIIQKKNGGCNYNNGFGIPKTISYFEPFSEQTYSVKFDRPNLKPVLAKATVSANNSVQDPLTAVQNAILAYAAGELEGELGFIIGADVSAFELAGAINVMSPGIFVKNLEIRLSTDSTWSNATIAISIFEKATIIASSISVVVV